MFKKGKVRDIYELPGNRLLIVTTDRISAFDTVMRQRIPRKGKVLTRLSEFWFKFLEEKEIVKTHFISASGRKMIVKKVKVIPIEWIVRRYLAGSEWEKFKNGKSILNEIWPKEWTDNLKEGSKLIFPIVTFTTKAEQGHDQDLPYKEMCKIVQEWLKDNNLFSEYTAYLCTCGIIGRSFAIYEAAAKYAESKGILIADTKFEFGLDEEGNLLLADEVLTPDSSRFWLKKDWQPGKHQEGYDKQPLRDWLEKKRWDKISPPPNLSRGIIKQTSKRYKDILNILTSRKAA